MNRSNRSSDQPRHDAAMAKNVCRGVGSADSIAPVSCRSAMECSSPLGRADTRARLRPPRAGASTVFDVGFCCCPDPEVRGIELQDHPARDQVEPAPLAVLSCSTALELGGALAVEGLDAFGEVERRPQPAVAMALKLDCDRQRGVFGVIQQLL